MKLRRLIKAHRFIKINFLLFDAGAVVLTERLGIRRNKEAGRKKPVWKRRIENKTEELEGLRSIRSL